MTRRYMPIPVPPDQISTYDPFNQLQIGVYRRKDEKVSRSKDYNYQSECYVQRVTQDFANEKLVSWHYELQRPLSKSNLKRLHIEHEAGRFVPGTPVFVCETPDERKWLVNGRHTFTMLSEIDKPLDIVIVTLRVPDMDAVGRIYGYFDIHKTRSYSDSLKAVLGGDPSPLTKKVLTGIPHILSGFVANDSKVQTREDRISTIIDDYISTGVIDCLYDSIRQEGSHSILVKKIKKSGIIAIAAYTTKHQASFASEFWKLVATESHPDPNHGSRVLTRYLRESKSAGGYAQQEDIYQAAKAWNASFSNDEASYFKTFTWHDDHSKFHILGTPWKKGKPNE